MFSRGMISMIYWTSQFTAQILLKPFSNLQLTSEGKFKWVDGNFLDNAYPLFIKKKF